MKRMQENAYFLTPQAEGWVVWCGRECLHTAATLDEAAALLPAGAKFQFALPCYPLIMERLRLPATERAELDGMVHLQWEKALPFSPDEIIGSFIILGTDESESDLWSVAVPQSALEEFSPPWRKLNRWPVHVVPFVCYVAAACPAQETVLVVYGEPGHWVLAVVEDRRPGWVHVLRGMDAPQFASELPSLLLTAGMEGVNHSFSRAFVGSDTAACIEALQTTLGVPVERLPLAVPSAEVPLDLLPPGWRIESQHHRGRQVWRRRLAVAGSLYLLLIIAAAVHLFLLQRQSSKLEAELNAARPDLVAMQARETRSNALSLAIDPHHYTIELLFLLQRCLPAANVQFTEFEQLAQQWRVVGEAPSAALAVDFLTRLKHDPDLSSNEITADPPRPLPNDKAQFQVTGKP